MPVAIPPVLVPYLQSSLTRYSLTLLTSVLETPSHWLIPRFFQAVLYAVDADAQPGSRTAADDGRNNTAGSVTFLSIVRSFELWAELSKKIGLDLSALSRQKRFTYIDGLTGSIVASQATPNSFQPKSRSLQDLASVLTTANSTVSQDTTSIQRNVLIIDGLDFVLASQPDISSLQMNTFISDLRARFSSVVITAAADSALLHNVEPSATPLEIEHSIFIRTLAHQSNWIFQLRPLETGHAKDVTGVVQIAHGGGNDGEDDSSLPEGEWLYQVKGDGNVKVWSRGE